MSAITLDASEIMLFIGGQQSLVCVAEPTDATNPAVLFTSSDETIATVSAEGVVTAVNFGAAIITATAADGSGVTAQCAVSVEASSSACALTGPARVQVGRTIALNATNLGAPIPPEQIQWTSSDPTIASVDALGVVTGVAVGNVTITATATNGSGLVFTMAVDVLRATVVIYTTSNAAYSTAVAKNNIYADQSIPGIGTGSKFGLMRLMFSVGPTIPDLSNWNPDEIIHNSDGRCVAQFTTTADAETAYNYLFSSGKASYIAYETVTKVAGSEDPINDFTPSHTYHSWGAKAMNADIANERLATMTGASVKVAVIDTGVFAHPFFGGHLNNAYDYVADDADPTDENGHGTHVAGIIRDLTQSLNVDIVAYRAFDGQGNAYTSNAVNAIYDAADDGCKVVNFSANCSYDDGAYSLYTNALQYLSAKGSIFCCAAGDQSSTTSNYLPAGYNAGYNVVVTSLNSDLTLSGGSNSGKSVQYAAPGAGIESCDRSGGFSSASGSSMACAHVSAAFAMAYLRYGSNHAFPVTDLGAAGKDSQYGYGMPKLVSLGFSDPTRVTINAPRKVMRVGDAMQFTASVEPEGAYPSVVWSCSSNDVYSESIDSNGNFTCPWPAKVRISATTINGLSDTVEILVVRPSISATSAKIGAGQTQQLSVVGNYGPVTWTSSDPKIATVSGAGLVTGVKVGTATITATFENLSFTCVVAVSKPVLTQTKLTITASQTTALQVLYSGKAVKWSSSRSSVAAVNSQGVITAKKTGTATITALVDGYKLSCAVTVKANATTYSISKRAKDYGSGFGIVISKAYYSGSTLYVEAYAIDNIPKVKLTKITDFTMYVSGNSGAGDVLIAAKNFGKITLNQTYRSVKKLTFKFSGSAVKIKNFDLRLGDLEYYYEGGLYGK